jgi:hypothetical protein
MAVPTLTEFPQSFVAGDTIRVSFSDSRYPSSLWTAKVLLQSPIAVKSFTATPVTGGSFAVVIPATDSALLLGQYLVAFVYTETSSGERVTVECDYTLVYANPEVAGAKSIARQTLEAMEAAYLKLASGSHMTVTFGGQSFTKRNLKEFNDMITQQQAVVDGEDATKFGHRKISRIVHPI